MFSLQKYILFFLFVVILAPLYSQQVKIEVVDGDDGKSIPGVIIRYEKSGKSFNEMTDAKGMAMINVNGKCIITLSVAGYKGITDTVLQGYPKKISLKKSDVQLKEIVVTGQFKPQLADESIYKVGVISSEQIKAKAATNLSDLLSTNISTRVIQGGVLGTNLYIQGLSGEQVKILIDGVPVIGRQDGFIDLGQLNLYNVDHIEMIEGPMSVIYGSNAMAGAINIITKEDTRDKLNAGVKVYYESIGQYDANADFSVHQDEHTFSLSGDRNFFGGYSTDPSKRSLLFNPYLQYDGNFSYLYSPGKSRLKLGASWFNQEYRLLGDLQPPFYEIATDIYYYTKRLNETANWKTDFSGNSSLDVLVGHSSYREIQNGYSNDLVTLHKTPADTSLQDTTKMESWIMRTTYAFSPLEKFDFQTGTDFNFQSANGKREQGYKEIGDYAAFLNVKYNPTSNLVFQPGVRAIYNTRFAAPLVYSFHTRWEATKNLIFRASYAKGFRSPELKELYLIFRNGTHNVTGNDTLKPEYSQNLNGSASYRIQKNNNLMSGELSLFYNHINNKIDYLYSTTDPATAHLINLPGNGYKTKGANLMLGYIWNQRLFINSGFELLGLSKLADYNQFYYSKDISANIACKLPGNHLKFSLFYKYNDKFYIYTAHYTAGSAVFNANNIFESYISNFHTLNFTICKSFFNETLELSTGLKNIFNNKTVSASLAGDPHSSGGNGSSDSALIGWGRTFFISLAYHFKK